MQLTGTAAHTTGHKEDHDLRVSLIPAAPIHSSYLLYQHVCMHVHLAVTLVRGKLL